MDDAIDIDETVDKMSKESNARYLEFWHPSAQVGGADFKTWISLHPDEDLEIMKSEICN